MATKKKTKKAAPKKKPVKKPAKKIVKKVVKKAAKKKIVKAAPVIKEKKVGIVDHFFNHIMVAAIKLKSSAVKVGDVLHIVGHTTNFTQPIASIQIDHVAVASAKKGADIGIKVKSKVRQGDEVFFAA
jgi:putative protease